MAATRPDIELQPTVNVKTTKALQTGCVHIEQMKLARQQRFGKKCESLAGMQRSLFEEDVDADIAEISAHLDKLLPQTGDEEKTTTRPVRKPLPSHLPRAEKVIPPAEERCPDC
ncbi:TPA: transposase domain-containing protein, partial [Escherichia coli]